MGGERLQSAELRPGRRLAGDRAFALIPSAAGETGQRAGWRPKSQCLALVRTERLAAFSARADDEVLTILKRETALWSGNARDPLERRGLERKLNCALAALNEQAVAVVSAGDEALTDTKLPWISLLNEASVAALAESVQRTIDPLRFRANLWLKGFAAWEERGWLGRIIRSGRTDLEITGPIGRCAAVDVNPDSALRDTALVTALSRQWGHTEMGVYAAVRQGGPIAVGDRCDLT